MTYHPTDQHHTYTVHTDDGVYLGHVDGTGGKWTAWLDIFAGRQVTKDGYGATFPDRETAGQALMDARR